MEAIADIRIGPTAKRWPRVRWILLILVMFSAHAGLVVFFSRPQAGLEPKRTDSSSFRLIAGTPQEALVAREISILDPSLFGSANAKTFSGLAWIRRPVFEYQLPSWAEPSAYLELPENVWASTPFQKASIVENSFAEKLAPSPSRPTLDVSTPPSRFSIDQLPGGRALVYAADLPVQAYTDVLSSSVVQASVDSHGAVISARLISGSGSKKADEDALAISRFVRFKPSSPSNFAGRAPIELDWAILRFQWFTIDPEPAIGVKKQLPRN